MMGMNFPNTPSEGAVYASPGGQQYTYTNGVWLQTGFAYTPLQTAEPYSRVVNGAMQIAQENVTASTANGYYAADQWLVYYSTTAVVSFGVVGSVTPNGSPGRLRATITTADASIAAGDYYQIYQAIEGVRFSTQWGTANAKQVVVRFGFKGPAGTYSFRLSNNGGTARTYLANFTIAAGQANTDTVQTFVIPGDTTGTWDTNSTALAVQFSVAIACGTTYQGVAGWNAGNLIATNAITNNLATNGSVFELFDVGLYLDPQATGKAPQWQTPDYAQELAACQRYWETTYSPVVGGPGTGNNHVNWFYKVIKRVIPTFAGGGGSTFDSTYTVNTDSLNVYRNINAPIIGTGAVVNARM
jgi:hypothetical protein